MRQLARLRTAIAAAALAGSVLLGVGVSPPAAGQSTSPSSSVCGYYFEWLRVVRFPVQPDPHAAYSYVAVSTAAAEADHVAFVVDGNFPYAAWTSWDIYGAGGKPFAVTSDADITPDSGSVNPFVVGNRVRARRREFTLLYLPGDVQESAIAPSLQAIANVSKTPTAEEAGAWVLANRVYQALPQYNQGGSAGPTDTPFPEVRAVNYLTGDPVACAPYNVIPEALQRLPTDPPRSGSTDAAPKSIKLTSGESLQRANSPTSIPAGVEYAPPNPPGLLQFTRPPAAAGADVASVPAKDNCAGYLGTATSLTRISLIRMPHVPTFFNTSAVGPATTFPNTQAAYVSATQYGASLGTYSPGSPFSTSVGDSELEIDKTGGSTILVWPRTISAHGRRAAISYAQARGWAILRGGTQNKYTTANLLIREKRSSGYANSVGQVKCYYGTPQDPEHTGQPWSKVHGSRYVASPRNIDSGAPQGVTCTVQQLTEGACLRNLKAYIRRTGGHYFAK